MTITAQTSKTGPYSGNGTTTVFSYTFKVQDEAHLVVTVLAIDGVTESIKVLNTDYTVTGVGNPAGGTIVMGTAPVTGEKLTITRNVTIDQDVDLQNRGAVNPETLEESLDKLTQLSQDQQEQISRSLKVDLFEQADLDQLTLNVNALAAISPDISTVAGISADVTAVAADATDIGVVSANITNVNTVAGISSDVTAVVADAADIGIVATDLTGANTIGTVAGIAANVTTVAGISADVTAVAGDAIDIGTVSSNITNVNTVAGISGNVTTVAGISADVTAVAADATDIGVVSANITNVNTVAGISANVTTVAGISADVTAVAADATDIGVVSANITNVNTVAGISADVTAVAGDATDIGTVSSNIANVNTVAGISGNVTTVAGISGNVTTVAGISADVTTVAADGTDIGTVATNIANVNTVAGISGNVTAVAGISADVTAVAGDATDIGTVATNIANVNTVAGISADVTTVAGISADVVAAPTYAADAESARDQSQAARDTANLHKLAAEAAATSATNTAASLTGFDLDAIAASKAVTAVDVFVYDTSRDSDGGAWRKRCQHTSWYNEALNTTTRGARREFPAVAVIVAEAAKVTIYDGDDPALPMWMAFTYVPGCALGNADFRNRAISAINGVLAVGTAHPTYADYGGVMLGAFPEDAILYHGKFPSASDKPHGNFRGGLALRQSAGYDKSSLVSTLTSGQPRDVAMTVLPDAPIDPATGLPVPTIAVATDGGVSVIKDDGTVVDLTYTASVSNDSGGVWFPASGGIAWQSRSASGGYVYTLVENGIPTADKTTAPDAIYANFGQVNFVGNDLVTLGASQPKDFIDGALGSPQGLTHLDENTTTPANGMVAYTTSTYNTGWMNGDIKGAFLSDTDDTDLVGSIVEDSQFTGTGATDGWTIEATATNNNGVDQLNITTGASSNVVANKTITGLTAGAWYKVQMARVSTGKNSAVFAGTSGTSYGTIGVAELTFKATYTSQALQIRAGGAAENIAIDNISVKLADADRSVNNNGLIVNGTVTRTAVATGADLVSYSGFSASNYLEQPYNSGLDFGTGDFCVMGWVKTPDTGSSNLSILRRQGDTGLGQFRLRSKAGKASFWISDDNVVTIDEVLGTTDIDNNAWHFITALKNGTSTVQIYVDGCLEGTDTITAATGSLNSSDATIRLGLNQAVDEPWIGSLALLRISATAPTAEQIAKIYNDELPLFQENAQATLYGASDAVTALAHDPVTDLLHVGTSAGRSVFKGLERLSNTTNSVSKAISVVSGLVAEK